LCPVSKLFRVKYFISFSLFILLFACGATQTENSSAPETPLNQDSINALLLKIHAKEKAYQIDTLFKNKVKKSGFNGCVLVAQHGVVIYKKAFGYANFKTKDSLRLNSAFQLASASKTLTAAAVLLLKDRGVIKLTDSVQKYLPGFPYSGITIQMLLTHRSGLSNYVYFCEPYCDKPNNYNGSCFNNAAMFEIIKAYKPGVYAKPGKKFEYCNTNYALLALIVEQASGKSFPVFMHENIFQPLGMTNTWVHDAQTDKQIKFKTIGYTGGGKPEEDTYADDVYGDKGIYSTVEDLYKWDQALYSEKLLQKNTIEEAFKGYSNEHKGKRNYGYGWRMIDDGKNPKIIYHNGWWHGYSTLFMRRPSDQATVIVLSNKFNRSTYHVDGVLKILSEGSSGADISGEE
jgi:CubicO group peptidase (beta-lactamase class C family)